MRRDISKDQYSGQPFDTLSFLLCMSPVRRTFKYGMVRYGSFVNTYFLDSSFYNICWKHTTHTHTHTHTFTTLSPFNTHTHTHEYGTVRKYAVLGGYKVRYATVLTFSKYSLLILTSLPTSITCQFLLLLEKTILTK